jgi:hypothetical protein
MCNEADWFEAIAASILEAVKGSYFPAFPYTGVSCGLELGSPTINL